MLRDALLVCMVLPLVAVGPAWGQEAGGNELISRGPAGPASGGNSSVPSLSADGRFVAFASAADDLVPGDTNGVPDVFVRDRALGTTQRITRYADGSQAVYGLYMDFSTPSISGDGRYVVYTTADPFDPADADPFGQAEDVYLFDRVDGTNTLVSRPLAGPQPYDLQVNRPRISRDGRFITYAASTNGPVDDPQSAPGLVLVDRVAGTRQRLAPHANNESHGPGVMSADGRWVAFSSRASNLDARDANGIEPDVFVLDRVGGGIELVSRSSAGAGGDLGSIYPAISGDGRFVAFHSFAGNLDGGYHDGNGVVYVHDRQSGVTSRASVRSDGSDPRGTGFSAVAQISDDGRFVLFHSTRRDVVPGDINGDGDLFIRDRRLGVTRLVNVPVNSRPAGPIGTVTGIFSAMTPDGSLIAYSSYANDLSDQDAPDAEDVFVTRNPIVEPQTPLLALRVNFQPATAPVPAGYQVDSGAVFGPRGAGWSYGWNVPNPTARDRNAPNSPDQRYDTLIHTQAAEARDARWEVALPNGIYAVRLVGGDPLWIDGNYRVLAEGQPLLGGRQTSSQRWFDATRLVTVGDGRLTLSNAPGSYNTKLCFVEIRTQGDAGPFMADINFQPVTAPTVPGWRVDSGEPFGERGNGLRYGWNALTDTTRDRNSPGSPDQLHDTLIHMQAAANPRATWEISVPNGWYTVDMLGGDPSFFDAYLVLDAEGVNVVRGRVSPATPWIRGERSVLVQDGRLTVTSGPYGSNNKLDTISIIAEPRGNG